MGKQTVTKLKLINGFITTLVVVMLFLVGYHLDVIKFNYIFPLVALV